VQLDGLGQLEAVSPVAENGSNVVSATVRRHLKPAVHPWMETEKGGTRTKQDPRGTPPTGRGLSCCVIPHRGHAIPELSIAWITGTSATQKS
jgi:hypothetical protein